MTITTTDFISGREIIETIGLVEGSTIQAKHLGKDLMAGLKQLVGGELTGYSEMLQEAREIALNRMKEKAQALGANAVVSVRFSTSSIMDGAAEILAYGTAVKTKLDNTHS